MTELALPADVFGTVFRPLPAAVTADDVITGDAFVEALIRVVRCHEGKQNGHGVAVWALDRPYTHQDGKKLPSCVTYIEKFAECLAYRWPRAHLANLGTDGGSDGKMQDRDCLRELAHRDYNWSFYSPLIKTLGPLRIWQATVDQLNAAGHQILASQRDWERHFLMLYRDKYGCLPPKNRTV